MSRDASHEQPNERLFGAPNGCKCLGIRLIQGLCVHSLVNTFVYWSVCTCSMFTEICMHAMVKFRGSHPVSWRRFQADAAHVLSSSKCVFYLSAERNRQNSITRIEVWPQETTQSACLYALFIVYSVYQKTGCFWLTVVFDTNTHSVHVQCAQGSESMYAYGTHMCMCVVCILPCPVFD
jgi:hypothetical protein